MNKCPCVQDCPRRTATCKVDGSCPDFEVYEKVRMKSYAEKAKERDKAIATNPRLGAAHQRIIKKNDRYKIDCKNEASHIKTTDRKEWVERVKRAEKRLAPRKSCCMYDPISDDCTCLNALWCTSGECKFYKPRERADGR